MMAMAGRTATDSRHDTPLRPAADDGAVRVAGATVVAALGLGMAAVEVVHVTEMTTLLGAVVWAVLPLLTNVTLVCVGVGLWRSDATRDEVLRVTAWVVAGALALAAVATWTIVHQNVRGRPFAHALFVTVSNSGVGGVVGALLGWYDVRTGRRERDAERERERADEEGARLEFLNRLLRHNVLNGMNVVLGHGERLEPHVDPAGREHLETMLAKCDDVVRLIQRVRTVTAGVVGERAGESGPRDLGAVLADQVESARLAFEHAEFEADLPSGPQVVADDLLPVVFENVLTNAVYHNDKETPHVSVSVTERPETAVVRVADNGPGIPEEVAESLFEWNARGEDSTGTGIGLAIVRTLVERYGGSVRVRNRDPEGAVVTLELPKAETAAAGDGEAPPPEDALPSA